MPSVPPTSRADELPAAYPQFLAEIKARIGAARTRAVLAVNSELIQLYWEIGHEILERERREGWGAKIIDGWRLILRRELPDMTGFSRYVIFHTCASFARAWTACADSKQMSQQAAATLPWGHYADLAAKR